ncbi:uncharacterized protein LOC129003036 [Macrosteles quadrilineatus]|uniref:uncharacterized protein LOC129003036 n=1 Tax=Macrosteles quadrilineatus TaxID=74068 RepID=UPI0023E0A7E5|nr:uncharacterized protein LOC129003036 [Macrosteles quadrilineatus]
MATSKSSSVSGRPLGEQAREIVYKVAEHLKGMKKEHDLTFNLAEETSTATGIGQTLVKQIIREGKRAIEIRGQLTFSTPTGKKTERKKRIEVDDFTKAAIRRKIQEMYILKKELPTVKTLISALEEADILTCGRTYLISVLKQLGFKWVRCQSRRKLLVEIPSTVDWRIRYLKKIKKCRSEGFPIVYIDETYVNANHTVSKCWQSPEEPGVTKAVGKGERLIIAHGGGENGFVRDSLAIFKAHQKTGDYHESMNYENFNKWLEKQLLPNLEEPSVIVMDNAKYHCVEEDKKPTSGSLKKNIQDWLHKHNIDYDENFTKVELLMLVQNVQREPVYKIDQLINNFGHQVLRLPPYHPDLNPIELVWGAIKGQVGLIYVLLLSYIL